MKCLVAPLLSCLFIVSGCVIVDNGDPPVVDTCVPDWDVGEQDSLALSQACEDRAAALCARAFDDCGVEMDDWFTWNYNDETECVSGETQYCDDGWDETVLRQDAFDACMDIIEFGVCAELLPFDDYNAAGQIPYECRLATGPILPATSSCEQVDYPSYDLQGNVMATTSTTFRGYPSETWCFCLESNDLPVFETFEDTMATTKLSDTVMHLINPDGMYVGYNDDSDSATESFYLYSLIDDYDVEEAGAHMLIIHPYWETGSGAYLLDLY